MLGLLPRVRYKAIRDAFVKALVEKTKKIVVGNPLDRGVYIGPVINEAAVQTFERAVAQATKDGGKILIGGHRLTSGEFAHGRYVEPTVIDGLPAGHPLFNEELFVPITIIADVLTLDEAIELANKTEYGLTAGIFSEDEGDLATFLDWIQAGVTYANRRAGATTGAWPGVTRSAAGRRAARPAAAAADPITCSSSCVNRAGCDLHSH